jgi:hypothetical protein
MKEIFSQYKPLEIVGIVTIAVVSIAVAYVGYMVAWLAVH